MVVLKIRFWNKFKLTVTTIKIPVLFAYKITVSTTCFHPLYPFICRKRTFKIPYIIPTRTHKAFKRKHIRSQCCPTFDENSQLSVPTFTYKSINTFNYPFGN